MVRCEGERAIRLSAADEAWLRMEDPRSRTIITAVMITGTPLPFERAVGLLGERLSVFPRFRCPVRGRGERVRPAPFDLRAHVRRAELPPPGDDAALRAWIEGRVTAPLPRDRPLWQVHVVERPGSTVLVWRIHHALGDGTALLRVLQEIADTPPPPDVAAPMRRRRAISGFIPLLAGGAFSVLRLLWLSKDAPTSLKRPLEGSKRIAWSAPVRVEAVREVAKAEGATINDVLLAALAGALRAELLRRGEAVPAGLRAIVPFDLRTRPGKGSLGNRIGILFVPLPVGEPSPRARLRAVHRRMARLKAGPEAHLAFRLLELVGRLSPAITAVGLRYFGSRATMMLTNVAGPGTTLHLGGAPIREIEFWIPHVGDVGLGFSVLSYAGTVRIGVMADAACAPEPQPLADAFAAALAELGVVASPAPNERPSEG